MAGRFTKRTGAEESAERGATRAAFKERFAVHAATRYVCA